VAAAAHVPITGEHLREAPYIGIGFVALEIACLALAVLFVLRERRAVWLAAALVGGAAVAAYALSRSVALPQVADDLGDWANPLGMVAVAAESLLTVVAATVLLTRSPRPATRDRWAAPTAAAALLLGLGATAVATGSAEGEGMSHPALTGMAGMAGMNGKAGTTGSAYWNRVGGAGSLAGGVTRTYYIGADEVRWNYAPSGHNEITGKPFDDIANVFVARGPGRIGSTYRKCLYRGYTDSSFTHRARRPAAERYLGMLGPVIRAEVGDTIKVVFRNGCSFPTTVHPHGVFYTKNSEGAPYADGTRAGDKADDGVPTGGRHTYVWRVPERAGPGPGDGSSVMWMYHSHADEVGDTNAGLMGPMVVTRRGMARPDGSPVDVDREVFDLFSVINENQSPYLHPNTEEFAEGAPGEEDEGFEESNLMHSVNGFVYGNQPVVTVHRGSHVRWYVMSMGTEVDLHTPHWHGNDVTVNGMRMDVVSLLPAGMVTADMVPDDPGTWLFHCHVNDHISAGMLTRYRVVG
jgi:hypothetical protein